MTFHIRSSGRWTHDLYAIASGGQATAGAFVLDDSEVPQQKQGAFTRVAGLDGAVTPLLRSEQRLAVPEALRSVSIDGPYGRMPPFGRHRTVVLLAGGIGITPLISIASDVLARWQGPPAALSIHPPATARIVLVWTVRNASLLAVFADRLAPLLRHPAVDVHLHVTGRRLDDSSVAIEVSRHWWYYKCMRVTLFPHPPHCQMQVEDVIASGMCSPSNSKAVLDAACSGRPDLQALFASISYTEPAVEERVAGTAAQAQVAEPTPLAMVCGPAALGSQVSDLCFDLGWEFHAETFEL